MNGNDWFLTESVNKVTIDWFAFFYIFQFRHINNGVTIMKQTIFTIATILIVASMGLGGHVQARPGGFDCDRFSDPDKLEKELSKTIGKLKRGDTLKVSGTCNVNFVIPADVSEITLDGQGTALLHGPDSRRAVVHVIGRAIGIKGFEISGGQHGVQVNFGGQLFQKSAGGLVNNYIHHTGNHGVIVHTNSSAKILDNTIVDNPGLGVNIFENSVARIGTKSTSDNPNNPKFPNVIERNGQGGIQVDRSSTAQIMFNHVLNNLGTGVRVVKGSQAHVIANDISSNDGTGVSTAGSSSVQITDNTIDRNAYGVIVGNNAKASLLGNKSFDGNTQYAVGCYTAGVVIGSLGDLTGPVDMDETCVEILDDYPAP
jgi:hypothetical protein